MKITTTKRRNKHDSYISRERKFKTLLGCHIRYTKLNGRLKQIFYGPDKINIWLSYLSS